MRSHLAALFAVPCLATTLAAQATFVVAGGGTSLQTAINTAAPGDILDVMPGSYVAATCSKGIHIALRPGAEVGPALSTTISLLVSALPANETCIVSGGKVAGLSISQCAGTVVVDGVAIYFVNQTTPQLVANCTGPVVFDSVDHTGYPNLSYGLLQITNCPQVTFTNCKPAAMTVLNSAVCLAHSTLTPYGFGTGVHLQSGSVTVHGGRITGALTASWPVAQPGIRLDQGTLTLTGNASIEPSPAGLVAIPTPGIATTGGAIRRDPGVVVLGLPISGPASIDPTPSPSLAITATASTMNVSLRGEPGSAVFTFAGLPFPAYATPWGEAWLLPTDPILDVAILPATGTAAFTHSFAVVPPWFVLVVQSVALRPNGDLVVGAPFRFAWN